MPYDPRGLSFEEWATYTVSDLGQFGTMPIRPKEDEWLAFGEQLLQVPALAGQGVPAPAGFKDWQSWAHQVNEAMRQLGL